MRPSCRARRISRRPHRRRRPRRGSAFDLRNDANWERRSPSSDATRASPRPAGASATGGVDGLRGWGLRPMRKAKGDYAILTVTNALRLLEEFRGEMEIGVAELGQATPPAQEQCVPTARDSRRGRVHRAERRDGSLSTRHRCPAARAGVRAQPTAADPRAGVPGRARGVDDRVGPHGHARRLRGRARRGRGTGPHGGQLAARRASACRCTARRSARCCSAARRRPSARRSTSRSSASRGLEARTRRSIHDPVKFFEHVRTVAGQGFALDLEECEEGSPAPRRRCTT